MNLCIGERLDAPGWTGLPLGRFAPPGHGRLLPVAAMQDTLFVWKDGASAARVRSHRRTQHYARHDGVLDLMAADEEAFIAHDQPESPGECLLVALPPEVRAAFLPEAGSRHIAGSRFDFADPLLYELARALERQCLEGEPLGRLYTESVSTTLVACAMARHADTAQRALPSPKSGIGRLSTAQQARLYRHIEDHLAENISLLELAALVGYSPAHFLRLFRRTFGQTPHQFLLERRIEHAKRLLCGDHHSLTEIAGACGFADQSHFGASFARRAGMSPGRYRNVTRES